jgi:hypothetical protein
MGCGSLNGLEYIEFHFVVVEIEMNSSVEVDIA